MFFSAPSLGPYRGDMLGSLGLFNLIAVAILSSLVSIVYLTGLYTQSKRYSAFIRSATQTGSLLSIAAVVMLAVAFYQDDFSILYVAEHSNTQLPSAFKIAAVWAGHEGSLLFWVLTLSCWAGLIAKQSHYRTDYHDAVLWVMNLLLTVFAWFTLVASNPFELNSVLVSEGRDLNPMLQDVGLIFHPPLLYLGYVGFSVVLAFSVAALMVNPIELEWVKHCRTWCLVAWCFLTAGIALGSWWAYYELGWGGWWFWDPVENASLLPWLTATALLHILGVANGKKQLLKWSFSLAFITFSLSILGTFIVRSGLLTSVHAFAVDPSKGLALLTILVVVLMSSFSLLSIKGEQFESQAIRGFKSKGFMVLIAALILILAMSIVLFGTFYPVVFELLGLGTISVGAPYFNLLIAPLGLLALATMGVSPLIICKSQCTARLMVVLAVISILSGSLFYLSQVFTSNWLSTSWMVLVTWCLACWVVTTHGYSLWRTRNTRYQHKLLGMSMAHFGVALLAVGAGMNSFHSFEASYRLAPSSQVEFMDWTLNYQQTELYVGNNYTAERGVIEAESGTNRFVIAPERRHYPVRVMNMSEPAMKWFWHGDIYITMGEKVDSQGYAFRVQYKAYVRWIWLGALLMMLGSIVLVAQRYKRRIQEMSYEVQCSQ